MSANDPKQTLGLAFVQFTLEALDSFTNQRSNPVSIVVELRSEFRKSQLNLACID
jgi:hypothetical protein